MRAVGYFRETASDRPLAEQSKYFLEFCRNNGYEAAAVFLDASPTTDDTPGFRQMVEFLRSQRHRGFILVAAPALDSLGERVRAAMGKRAVKGEALGRPPYGYCVGPRRRLQIVAEEGSVVRYIFRLYLKDGLGIRRIARRLHEEELHPRRGLLWSMVTVRDLLRNRAYVGTYSRFGVRVPASHPPLISPEDFQPVQERLDQRRPKGSARETSRFLLSGLAYCGYCGNKMIGVTRRQRWQRRSDGEVRTALYPYYQCESRTNRSLCDYHTRRAEALEEEVRGELLNGQVEKLRPAADPEKVPLQVQGKQL